MKIILSIPGGTIDMFSAIEEEGERLERKMRYREILERDREIKRKGEERERDREEGISFTRRERDREDEGVGKVCYTRTEK